jgi:hypothetical protein
VSDDAPTPRDLEEEILSFIAEAERDRMSAGELHATLLMIFTAAEEPPIEPGAL